MSFSSQRAVCYLVDSAIPILIANWLYKTLAVLKRQRFKDSGSDKMEPRGSKQQRLDLHDNKEEENLDEFEGENKKEGIGYVPLPFITSLRKESNHSTNMGKETRSLNHLVYIPKIG